MKILLRLSSDLTTKSDKIRARFVSRMLRNLQHGMRAAGIVAEIERQWSRIFVVSEDARILDLLGRLFGLSSYSLVETECTATVEAIVEAGLRIFSPLVAGKSYAVRVKRTGNHPFRSSDIAQGLGGALRPFAASVDLGKPDVEAQIEVRGDIAYLYSHRVRGAGGLPLGVSGRALCLLSGGFDSAVAAWMMMKRGVEVDFLFCNLAGAAYERAVHEIAAFLQTAWGFGGRSHLNILDFEELGRKIAATVRPAYAQVVLKRQFYRAAERLAERHNSSSLLTGECVGQVASQTLLNLRAIETILTLPVLRPVVGLDKEEIIELARRIGTFELSAAVKEYCQLSDQKPVTAATPEKLDREEAKLNPQWLDEAYANRQVRHLAEDDVRHVPVSTLAVFADTSKLFVEAVPEGAVVIDCREERHFEAWHWPGAINFELHELLEKFRTLERASTYVLYCPVGLQSAVAAEAMQKAGWTAFSVRGGLRRLKV